LILLRYLRLYALCLVLCPPVLWGAAVSGNDKTAVVQTARKDLAQRLKVSERSIELAGPVEEVTWPDASLGCPEPGMAYAQMLTPGFRVTLRSNNKLYQYHAGGGVVRLYRP
jgi:hypothetical protein